MAEPLRKHSVASNHADSSLEFYVANHAASTANRITGGVALTDVNYIGVACRELYIDDVRFSNSPIAEVNILAPGNIG